MSAGLLEIIKHSQLGRKIEGGFLQRKQQRGGVGREGGSILMSSSLQLNWLGGIENK